MSGRPEEFAIVRESDRLVYGGLLGLAATAVPELATRDADGSTALQVALGAFAVAIPILAASLITELVRSREAVARWRQAVGMFGSAAAVVGMAAVFFHVGPFPGLGFLASSVMAVVLVRNL